MNATIGIVAIGRNEGPRLQRCLQSIQGKAAGVVYVDSGSTDPSVTFAKQYGAEVIELDTNRPFSAARARNEGFNRLLAIHPELQFVQFVDGDCEIIEGWLDKAQAYLVSHPDVAIV